MKLKNHDIFTTDDGSLSAFSRTYGENFHNTTGAEGETLTHYVQGCKVIEKAPLAETFRILEVGFGLGVGATATFKTVKDMDTRIEFVSFEIDEELPKYFFAQNEIFKDWSKVGDSYVSTAGNFTLKVVCGDARETIKNLTEKYQAIYQDAFSPKRNATLWTKEWFEELKEISAKDCIMSTYSASSSVRKAMLAAGWKLQNGVKFGPKRSSTRAYLQGDTDQEIIERLERSPAIVLTDENAKDYHL